jgi:transcriptional regulator with XRE-family HTH domain
MALTVELLAQSYAAALRRRAENGAPSQREMGAALGLSKPHISEMIARYEAGDPPKSIRLLLKLCLAAGIAPIFAPEEVVQRAELSSLSAEPRSAAMELMASVDANRETAALTHEDLAQRCDTYQSMVSSAFSRYRKGDVPRSTEMYFAVAGEAGLVPTIVSILDFVQITRALDRLMTRDERRTAAAVAQDERASIARCLAELKERADPEFDRHFANAKLPLEDVAHIRGSFESLDDAAVRFGISKSTASYIRNELTWKPNAKPGP